MKVSYHNGNTYVDLTGKNQTRLAFLYLTESFFFIMAAFFLLYGFVLFVKGEAYTKFNFRDLIVLGIFTSVVTPFFFALALLFFSKIFDSEQMILSWGDITITKRSFFVKKSKTYYISEISGFEYCGSSSGEPPIFGEHTVDYSLIESRFSIMSHIFSDRGHLRFVYEGNIIRFGKHVYSWHAEELARIISKGTGWLTQIALPGEVELPETLHDI